MKNRKGLDFQRVRKFLRTVDQLLADLPTELEKKHIEENLSAVADFVAILRRTVAGLPSADDLAVIRGTVRQLNESIAKAEANPLVGGVFRGPAGVRTRLKRVSPGQEELAAAERHVRDLEALPVDEMRARLGSEETYSMEQLRALARLLGIHNALKLSRDILMHQISSRIANYRGYRRLGGEDKVETEGGRGP